VLVPKGRIGWRWLVWHRFSHENRTQLPSRLQLHDSKKLVRASGIFDSHRPLHFPPTLVNDSELDLDDFDDALQRRKVGGISCVERQSIGCGR
jgi:hypothetical protein